MIGVEFVEDRQTKIPAHDLRERIVEAAFMKGLILLGCGESTIRVSPPLNINKDLIDEGLQLFEQSIAEAAE